MFKSRQYVKSLIRSVEQLIDRHDYIKKDLAELSTRKEVEEIQLFYSNTLERLNKIKKSLPIGNRYTGTFYVKKPYSCPTEYQKIEGSAFMREDLVSWDIENSEDSHGYYRAIFKTADEENIITREECEEVYSE